MKILKINTERRRLGDLGEREAARLLKKKGYKILEKNYVMLDHEIDIIAECESAVVFVEVKTRDTDATSHKEPRPASAVTPEKQRGIIGAAKIYLAYHPPKKHVRFDIIEVYVLGETDKWRVEKITHMKGAFDRDTARPRHYVR